jgi:hypothetical protein
MQRALGFDSIISRRALRAWKSEHPVLTRPLGRSIAETGNTNPARQAAFDGRFDQTGCEEGERDRHVESTTEQLSKMKSLIHHFPSFLRIETWTF